MSDDLHLEEKAIEAVLFYREALTAAEKSETVQALAHRALMNMLPELERAVLEDRSPSIRSKLFDAGAKAVVRLNEARQVLDEATARLEGARQALAALEGQLGYIPNVPATANRI
ncbi:MULTISPECIES: hypothetical protein [Bradyrhizobium]|uniref:Uncharacterized protein n=2 Tax=Bradyrhizobium TaxID=374 RepID=A0ACD3VM41_9BRAD|nr:MULTISPECIES: hypothetical protein [Bradyrhizobium]MCK7664597.1 hypothetical protein [Bradyrhizobium sp. 2S1]UGY07468.1 hypothetical protein J4P68_0040575 [Bradyrhizobium quebecense]